MHVHGCMQTAVKDAVVSVQDQLVSCTAAYVEETLMQHFGLLIAFVRAAEATSQGGSDSRGMVSSSVAASAVPVLKDFSVRWTSEIEALNKCARTTCWLLLAFSWCTAPMNMTKTWNGSLIILQVGYYTVFVSRILHGCTH